MDNIRSNFFVRNQCRKAGLDGLLVSLDAKKAFDSVSHQYIIETLKAYGVGDKFQTYFKTLYTDITVRVLVNGFFSESIKVERGVKQGDALSCSLFILCMDPLIRNINNNKRIKEIDIVGKLSGCKANYKASGYADDIAIICHNDPISIQEIFSEYNRLTNLSGLELNPDKTEILRLGKCENIALEFVIRYNNERHKISTVNEVKICGLYFCTDPNKEYDYNINSKIEKFEVQLKRWMCRNLTLEGKILIIKTYGLSQLIYNLQCYEMKAKEMKHVEKLIFKFIWCKEWANNRWVERIRRKVLKNEYEEGGLRAPDIECLDKSLKLKQFIRASCSSHPIAMLQKISAENLHNKEVINIEYDRVDKDGIIGSAQRTINILTDHIREEVESQAGLGETSTIVINMIGSIDISIYLRRKKKLLADCLFNVVKAEGIETLGDLLQELEYTRDIGKADILKQIRTQFPEHLTSSANNFISEINEKSTMTHVYLGNDFFVPLNEVKVSQLQKILKVRLNKTESPDYLTKLDINKFDKQNLIAVRKQIQNVKLRSLYYRLINKDFFTRKKLLQFKITEDDNCQSCYEIEDFKHLLWTCHDVQNTWLNLNKILEKVGLKNESLLFYEDVFSMSSSAAVNTIKLAIIQRFIQIDRQTNLSEEQIRKLIEGFIIKEKYIATKNFKIINFQRKWNLFLQNNY
jgi:hypothetical protein